MAALLLGGVLVGLLDRRPAPPKGSYQGVRDADDPRPSPRHAVPSGSTAVLERPEVDEAPAVVAEPEPAVVEEGETAPAKPEYERPEAAGSRLARLRARLLKSNNVFGKGLLALLSQDRIDDDVWDEIEETLLMADLGTEPTLELVDRLKARVTVEGTRDPEQVRTLLREELVAMVDPSMDRRLAATRRGDRPAVTMVVGVNGVGKTTTVGKLARVLVAEDRTVVLGAADTFRAAAAEQLATWGARVGVETVRSEKEGADPASVAFEAVEHGIAEGVDVVLVDTAGRLQNKANLMDELGKIKRVIEKQAEVDEVLLVLDATTGQNGLTQAKVFAEVVDVTGIVLTKLDGTAKGGIVIAIQRQLGVPVKLIGLGEGPDDLAPFTAEGFVDALLAD
ncbi:signal recognition particle-docking protein FtsY [Micrococcus luteus]|uniref:Signal recognition particle receptor FtsY n=1 Tax=Micrococcus luteus (strain ATCC 4698 / DSM 20030 / JCM 1464 / CCM 169 / CCUG 5858 / IAM 1056 / NBRC 3333 / NCIMB 9278 / NCTC 2665 / VKM Ac-2230) TaxID=465515 RepID=C5CAG4_MICLC|nr:signal recognition particle-docking protein FtsY [Micrococcus luteus NCTC 2665]ORE57348.1 signal recognition particle-docking protein FtsY [Micrococcus luteus]KAB1900544.1 signal recognition particle-docking protein FtsY [Micrococcus luteus NCTC 2665]QCY45794.1 signal recognition particle-docking protein FtsY [Micrococcus luteus]RFP71124.1 signal recognition particle-docking protein FtsY [Micrococcus luteus]